MRTGIRQLATLALGLAISVASYLMLIDTTDPPELYAMAGVALLATALFGLSRERGLAEATVRARWLVESWRLIGRVPVEIVLLCGQALAQLLHPRQERGALRSSAFSSGDGRLGAGRRAVAEALGSFSPGTIVIGVDAEREQVLVHQLPSRGDAASQADPLELG
ncbi:MAG: hypothetical protein ACYC91_08465 [Solirubrobacteraceae bacterium]